MLRGRAKEAYASHSTYDSRSTSHRYAGFCIAARAHPDFEVVACCLDGARCLAAIRSLTPDVVLLEDGFTDVTASDILAVVDDEGLSSRLVFFTATVTSGDLARALATDACGAIPMNAKPEALVQSLRLEKPGSDLARVGNEANGIAPFGNNVLALLTLNELTIMDFVADGLSDSEIARVLGVSLEIVRIHVDHARQKLGINSRAELAALALSRRYGAMSILVAAILAALDDSPGHAAAETFAMAANGCAEVVTIKLSRKEAISGGTQARGASKDRAGAVTGTLSPTGKLVDPGAEIAASLSAQAALNAPRPGASSFSIFTVAAFAALIYELDGANHAVQAFDFRDEIVTLFAASDANGLASALPGVASFGGAAVYDGAFKFSQSDTIARDGSELYVGNVHAEDGGSDREITILRGSGTVDVVAAAANEASERDPMQTGWDNGANQGRPQSDLGASDDSSEATKREASGDGPNHGQSQKALHESDDGSGEAEGQAKHEASGDGLNHGQSQKALHESDDSVAAKGQAKHEAPGENSNRGQTSGASQNYEDGPAAGKQDAQHPPASDSYTGKPPQDISTAFVNPANNAHSALKIETAGKGEPSSGNADQAKLAVGTELGDSFHFKNSADNTSSDMYDLQQLSYGNGRAYGDGQHAVAREEQFVNANWIGISDAHQDHSGHANLHATHDLIV